MRFLQSIYSTLYNKYNYACFPHSQINGEHSICYTLYTFKKKIIIQPTVLINMLYENMFNESTNDYYAIFFKKHM